MSENANGKTIVQGLPIDPLLVDIIESLNYVGIRIMVCKPHSDGKVHSTPGRGMISFYDVGYLEATVRLFGEVLEDFCLGEEFGAYIWSEGSECLVYVLTLPTDSMIPIGVMLKDHLGLDSAMCDDCRAELFGSDCEEDCPDCAYVRECTEADLANEQDDDPPCASGNYFNPPTL